MDGLHEQEVSTGVSVVFVGISFLELVRFTILFYGSIQQRNLQKIVFTKLMMKPNQVT